MCWSAVLYSIFRVAGTMNRFETKSVVDSSSVFFATVLYEVKYSGDVLLSVIHCFRVVSLRLPTPLHLKQVYSHTH